MTESETRLFREITDDRRAMGEMLKDTLGDEKWIAGMAATGCKCPLCVAYNYLKKKGFYDQAN